MCTPWLPWQYLKNMQTKAHARYVRARTDMRLHTRYCAHWPLHIEELGNNPLSYSAPHRLPALKTILAPCVRCHPSPPHTTYHELDVRLHALAQGSPPAIVSLMLAGCLKRALGRPWGAQGRALHGAPGPMVDAAMAGAVLCRAPCLRAPLVGCA